MLASPCGGVCGGTGFCRLFFELVDIFSVGMTVEVATFFAIMMARTASAMDAAEDPSAILYCLCLLINNCHC